MYEKYLQIKTSKNKSGVFSLIEIPAKVPIIEFTGTIIPKEKLNIDPLQYLQVGEERFIGPSGAIDDSINHSCNPNCRVSINGNRAILYSMYVISKNTEITFDYSTSSTDTLDSWKMKCACGAAKCRKIISGYQYLSEELKKEYESKGMVPMFITNPSMFAKKW